MTSLSTYFKGVASKYLSAVDATSKSNQHEIGSNKLTAILGNPGAQKLYLGATFLFFNPDLEDPEACSDTVTYYDVRLNQPNRRPEYRLYYRDNRITEQLREGDFCVVGALTSGGILIAVARPGTEHERRLRYLFDIEDAKSEWDVEDQLSKGSLNIASSSILEALGIEIFDSADNMLDRLVSRFGLKFPTTREFSAFARETLGNQLSARDDPDVALEEWMKQEERLFRTLERSLVEVRLKQGFESVDSFVSFSLSVQNRRKSRVGHALENHLEAVFKESHLAYARGKTTEGTAKPDFLFPSEAAYRDRYIDDDSLSMLAAKSTCKDRWRQVLTEAERIRVKHLFTLETAISENQTAEMQAHCVQLVVPPSVADTLSKPQKNWVWSLSQFIEHVRV